MLEKAVFDATIEDLEKVTTPLTDEQRQVYYEHLKRWPSTYLVKAVKALIETYRARRFPPIPLMRRVLDHIEIKDQAPAESVDGSPYDKFPCPACNNLGWWVEYKTDDDWGLAQGLAQTPHYVVAICQCDHGRRRRAGLESFASIQKRIEQKMKERRNEPFEQIFDHEEKG